MKKNTILIITIIFVVVIFVGLDYLNKKTGFRIINMKENFDIADDKLNLVNNLKNKKLSFKLTDESNWLSSKNINENITFYIDNEGNVKGDIYDSSELLTFNKITTDNIFNNSADNRCFLELKPKTTNNILDIKIIKDVAVANLFSANDDGDVDKVEVRIAYKNVPAKSYYNTIVKIVEYDINSDNIIELNTENDDTRIQFYKNFLLRQLSVTQNNRIYHLSLIFTENDSPSYFYETYGKHLEIYFNNVLNNEKLLDTSSEKNICSLEYTTIDDGKDKLIKQECYFDINIASTNKFSIIIKDINNTELFSFNFILKEGSYITKLVDDNMNLTKILNVTSVFNIKNSNNTLSLTTDNYSVNEINYSSYTIDELNEFNNNIATTLENGVYTDRYKLNRDFKAIENQYKQLNEYYVLKKNLEKNYLNLKRF